LQKLKIGIEREIDDHKLQRVCQEIPSEDVRHALKALWDYSLDEGKLSCWRKWGSRVLVDTVSVLMVTYCPFMSKMLW